MTRLISNKSMTAKDSEPFHGAAPHPDYPRVWIAVQDGTVYKPPCRFPCLRWDIVEEWVEENVDPKHRKAFYAEYSDETDDE